MLIMNVIWCNLSMPSKRAEKYQRWVAEHVKEPRGDYQLHSQPPHSSSTHWPQPDTPPTDPQLSRFSATFTEGHDPITKQRWVTKQRRRGRRETVDSKCSNGFQKVEFKNVNQEDGVVLVSGCHILHNPVRIYPSRIKKQLQNSLNSLYVIQP